MRINEAHSNLKLTRRKFLGLSGSAACAAGLGVLAAATGSLLAPETAYATVEGDQTPLTDAEIEEAIRSGQISTEFPESPISTYAVTNYKLRTYGGTLRYDTNSIQVSSVFSSSRYVIVASGIKYADSISAAGLAGALGCPIVLTEPDALSTSAAQTIRNLGASEAILLGLEDVATQQVELDLRGLVGTVTRLGGETRYDTQMRVYEYGVEKGYWGDTVVVACGTNFADALAVSPLSYKLKAPVFFVDDSKMFPDAQAQALVSSGKKKFIVTGGVDVISNEAVSFLSGLGAVTQLAGVDRYETSRKIASYAVSQGMSWEGVAFASGSVPFDALGGGPVQGKANSVIVLAEEGDYHYAPAVPFSGQPSVKFFGGKDVFSNAFKARFALAAGYKLTDIEGFRVYIDAGHGGWDSGALGCGYRECDLTADLAKRVANHLQADYGVASYTNLSGNDYKVRHPEAKAMDCSVFVSIHFNANGGHGTESYIHSQNSAAGSKALQNSMHSCLASALGLYDRGKKNEWFAVVSGPLPSVLLETCFIDNSSDMSTYQSRKDNVAKAIAQGIVQA